MEIKDEEIIDGILKKDKYAMTKLIDKYGSIIHNTVFFLSLKKIMKMKVLMNVLMMY